MNYLNGGYVMLDKADSDIFAKASGALQAGKPILWYEDKNTCYFIDTIEKTGSDSIALTKGGLTIVITSGNVVTEKGSIKSYLHNILISGDDTGNNLLLASASVTLNKKEPLTLGEIVALKIYLNVSPIGTSLNTDFGTGELEGSGTSYSVSLNDGDGSRDFADVPELKDTVIEL